jgi:hypothetical protein
VNIADPTFRSQEMPMVQKHDQVVLTCPLPAPELALGDVGAVLHVHGEGAAFVVEFMSLDGRTIGVQTLAAEQLRPVSASVVPHERLRIAD